MTSAVRSPTPVSVAADGDRRLWIGRIAITNFRSYSAAEITTGPEPVVLLGHNGAGKTNLLEAISLLSPGTGLRRAGIDELARIDGAGDWAVASRVNTRHGAIDIGTGVLPTPAATSGRPARSGRLVRIDGEPETTGALARYVEIVWLTPAMDGLFTGPASDRRRFLDRLVLCFDAGQGPTSSRFDRAMRQRNRLLSDGVRDDALFGGLETQLAETGVAIAAARMTAVAALGGMVAARRLRDPGSPFPWFSLALRGTLENELASLSAVEVEDRYRERLAGARERDRAAGRMLEGPHRSDVEVMHGPKSMPARLCSTGEQKALLMGLVLAHAGLIAERGEQSAPILLLDEIAAHFDDARRAALFAEIVALKAQAWMTGTDAEAAFARRSLGRGPILRGVERRRISPL